MSPAQIRAALTCVGVLLVLLVSAAVGAWAARQHYRPQIAEAEQQTIQVRETLAACRTTRGNLEAQVEVQNLAVANLVRLGEQRAAAAEQAQQQARVEAQGDYRAATVLLTERTGGDACQAAADVIDKELGL